MLHGLDPLYVLGVFLAVLSAIKIGALETTATVAEIVERYEEAKRRIQERRRHRQQFDDLDK